MARDSANNPITHYISWEVAELFRAQALRNHSQSLERLAERGGLSWCEAANALAGLDPFDRKTSINPDQKTAQAILAGALHALNRQKDAKK